MSWVDEYKNERVQRVGGKPCKFNKTGEREEYNKTMGIKLDDSFQFRRDVINRTAKQQRIKRVIEVTMTNFTLLKAMDNRGLTEQTLSDLTGLSTRAIRSYVYMERKPTKINAQRINRVLKTKVYEVDNE